LHGLNITKGFVLLTLDEGGGVDGGDPTLLPYKGSKTKGANVDIRDGGDLAGNGDGGFVERTAVASLAYFRRCT
jgi:hypothetical protein